MPKISVIVPVYNSSEFLRTCLDSLVSQTLKDLEIIVIDDCSTDNSLSILNEYAQKYPQIRVFHNQQNLGQGATRNRGIKLSTGEYIGFVDSDDYINPRMFEDMYRETIIHNQPDIVTTGIVFVKNDCYANTDLSYFEHNSGREIDFISNPDALCDESPAVWNKIFKKSFLGDYKFLENCLWEDVAFSFSKLIESGKVIFLNNPNYFYRRNLEKGISGQAYQQNNHQFDIIKVADAISTHAKKCHRYELFKPQIKHLQIATCFERLEEISKWNISPEEKKKLRFKMYDLVYQRYGTLEDINQDQLSIRISLDIIKEYNTYCQEQQTKKVL